MKLLFTSVLVLFCYVSVAQVNLFTRKHGNKDAAPSGATMLDKEYGFRGTLLESEFSSFKNMKLVTDDGNTKYYTCSAEELKIEDFEVYSIKYCFYKNKLMMISITTKGQSNSQKLLDFLKSRYGQITQENEKRYFVIGEKAKLNYIENPRTHEANLKIVSLPLTYAMFKDE